MRVATYNIRNLRALDRASWWWRRRDRLAAVMRAVGADVWGLQEAYRAQNDWLESHVFGSGWARIERGRNRRGGGETCPVRVSRDGLEVVSAATLWYGATPTRPGTRLPGARFPRLVTMVEIRRRAGGDRFVVANTHLDERSARRRRDSLAQLADWLRADHAEWPTILMGDLNCAPDGTEAEPLRELGLRPVLGPGDGPTANDFGRRPRDRQIDHVLVSHHWTVDAAHVLRTAGRASDHWPVVADVSLRPGAPAHQRQ